MVELCASNSLLSWYAIRVKSNRELTVANQLRARGFEEFVPLYRSWRVWSDRTKTLDLPLFPGYVFCRFDPHRRQPVVLTSGVVSIVGIGKVPQPVPDLEIEAIQRVVKAGVPAQPHPYLTAGDRVRIQAGPLAGVEGWLIEFKNAARIVLSVELLQRSIIAEVDRIWVMPSEPALHVPPAVGLRGSLTKRAAI